MKKILAVLSVIGVATLITGCSDNMKINTNSNYVQNFNDFKQHVQAYTNINEDKNTKLVLGKYKVSVAPDVENQELKNLQELKSENVEDASTIRNINGEIENENLTNIQQVIEENQQAEQNANQLNTQTENIANLNEPLFKVEDVVDNNNLNETEKETEKADEKTNLTNEQVSTLYSIEGDINNCCEDFVTLKQKLTDAIIETQNLINKVNSKEIELTSEQKFLITEQSRQLKDLSRRLAGITTELSISLSDLNELLSQNGDFNNLSLKYLIVLDNLVNGNEMLENGLHSLNLINNMFNTGNPIPPNNTGRILYGFRRNNEEPVIKDYLIDKDGKIVENNQNASTETKTETANKEENNADVNDNEVIKPNIDTMQNNLNTNVDSYRNHNSNVDSFFNTALLDNEFMYGNGYGANMMGNGLMYGNAMNNYGYGMPYGGNNMAFNNGSNTNNQNTNYGVYNNNNTQQNENQQMQKNTTKHKKLRLAKNVDTYKNDNTPTLSTRFGKVKKSISGFFGKFKKKENPIYKFDNNN